MHFHLQKPIVNRLKSPYLAHLSLFNLFTDLLFPTPSLSGKSYIVTFVDDHSRKLWGYSIRNKSDVYETFKAWKCEVGNASENSIITLRMDNGGEFTSNHSIPALIMEFIEILQFLIPQNKTQEQNDLVNLSIFEGVLALLPHSNLPKFLWPEEAQYYFDCKT